MAAQLASGVSAFDRAASPLQSPMAYETFPLRFEGCERVVNVPLIHSSHRVTCYVCQPELRDKPVAGKCPNCISKNIDRETVHGQNSDDSANETV